MFPPLFWGIDFGGMGTGRLGGMGGEAWRSPCGLALGFSREGGATYLPQADRRVGGTLPPTHKKPFSRSDEGVVGIS